VTKAGRLVWLDLETTGLEPHVDNILEIAVVVTDERLEQVEEYDAVIYRPGIMGRNMAPVVKDMHTANGLLEQCQDFSRSVYFADALSMTFDTIQRTTDKGNAHLAGNSIWMDKGFLSVHARPILEHLHYRMLDVSAIKVAAQLWAPSTEPDKVKPHRATDDVRASIAEMRHYLHVLMDWEQLSDAGLYVARSGGPWKPKLDAIIQRQGGGFNG
jgi:oligoribonuclease